MGISFNALMEINIDTVTFLTSLTNSQFDQTYFFHVFFMKMRSVIRTKPIPRQYQQPKKTGVKTTKLTNENTDIFLNESNI